ncbi:MAG: hypothetical protein JWP10_988, partial [Nocardioidaceae bacterium]|nr:hypothetical protein [Nocardioidaceae bacterium]
ACSSSDSSGGSDGGGSSEKPYQVLYSSGITGLLAPSAKGVERGIKAKIDTLNAAGGINGRKVELTTVDNQSDPTRGVTLVQKAIGSSKKPDLVIPGVSSNEALAIAPLLARNKIVGVGPASNAVLNDIKKYPYFYSQSAKQQSILAAVATQLKEKGGVTKVALIAPNDALGDALGAPFKDEMGKVGIKTTDTRFASDAVDITPAFQKAMEGNPDVIYMDAAGTQAAAVLSSRVKAGAEDIPAIAGVVLGSQPLLTLAKGTDQMKNVNLVMLPTQQYIPPADRSEVFNEFFKAVSAQGAFEVPLSTYSAGWESVALWADAVASIDGDVTEEKINKAMQAIPTSAPRLMFKVTFTPTNNFLAPTPDEFTIGQPTGVKDGMFEYTQN